MHLDADDEDMAQSQPNAATGAENEAGGVSAREGVSQEEDGDQADAPVAAATGSIEGD